MFMKKTLFTILFIVYSSTMCGQVLHYFYDDAGNRYCRNDPFDRLAIQSSRTLQSKTTTESERSRIYKIKAYPNPVHDILKVEITGLAETDVCLISVYSLSSVQLFSELVSSSLTSIEVNDYPRGIYLLVVNVNGEKETIKIVKEK